MDRCREHRLWLGLLALAGLVRGGWLAADHDSLRADPDTYRQLAQQLLSDGTLGYRFSGDAISLPCVSATAFRPPLYPLALAAVGWVDDVGLGSVAILHAVVGVATVLLVYRLSQGWRLGRWGFWAAVLVACDPILLNQSSRVMTETLATLLAVLGLLALTRLAAFPTTCQAVLAGIAAGLAAMCRPTFLVWDAIIVLAILTRPAAVSKPATDCPRSPTAFANGLLVWLRKGLAALQARLPTRFRLAGAFVLGLSLAVAPWAVRNALVFGRPTVTTTHGGYTLWLGNNEEFYRFLDQADWGEVWDSRLLDEQYLRARQKYRFDEFQADRWAYNQATAGIRREPASFVRACAFRVGSLWGVVPHRIDADESTAKRLARHAVGVWYVAVSVAALVGMASFWRKLCDPPWVWGLSLCLSFTAVHAVYWSNLRMRAPLVPVVCLAAVAGVRSIVSRRLKSEAASPEPLPDST